MASPVKTYQSEMHSNLGFFATWLPGDPIELGDIGVLENGRFRRMSTLKELGVSVEVGSGNSSQDLQYTSTKGFTLNTSGGARAKGVATAKLVLQFSAEGAFVFHATGLQPSRIQNRAAVAKEMLRLYRSKKWNKEWCLVESIHSAARATVIISQDSSAELVLAADAHAGIPALCLADPKVKLKVTAVRGKLFQTIGAKDLHPLYACLRLNDPLFGDPSVQPVRGQTDESIELSRPGIAELLDS